MCEEAKCGENLSIMKGDFEVCLQGTHADLKEGTEHDSNLAKNVNSQLSNPSMKFTMYAMTFTLSFSQNVLTL